MLPPSILPIKCADGSGLRLDRCSCNVERPLACSYAHTDFQSVCTALLYSDHNFWHDRCSVLFCNRRSTGQSLCKRKDDSRRAGSPLGLHPICVVDYHSRQCYSTSAGCTHLSTSGERCRPRHRKRMLSGTYHVDRVTYAQGRQHTLPIETDRCGHLLTPICESCTPLSSYSPFWSSRLAMVKSREAGTTKASIAGAVFSSSFDSSATLLGGLRCYTGQEPPACSSCPLCATNLLMDLTTSCFLLSSPLCWPATGNGHLHELTIWEPDRFSSFSTILHQSLVSGRLRLSPVILRDSAMRSSEDQLTPSLSRWQRHGALLYDRRSYLWKAFVTHALEVFSSSFLGLGVRISIQGTRWGGSLDAV